MYRIFVDEVGNHDLKSSNDPNHRYLGLTGVIMRLDYEQNGFTNGLNTIKQQIFGTVEIVLHRREMLAAEEPFQALASSGTRAIFDGIMGRLYRRMELACGCGRERPYPCAAPA